MIGIAFLQQHPFWEIGLCCLTESIPRKDKQMKDMGSAGKIGFQAQRGSFWQGCVRSGLGGSEGQALQAET